MTNLREIIYRSLGYNGESFNYYLGQNKITFSCNGNQLLIQDALTSKEGAAEVIATIDLDDEVWGLYKPDILTKEIVDAVCKILRFKPEKLTYSDNLAEEKLLIDVEPNVKEFPNVTAVPMIKSTYSHRYLIVPTTEYPNGEERIDGENIEIFNKVVKRFVNGKIDSYIPGYLNGHFELADGTEVFIRRKWGYWYLVKIKRVGHNTWQYPILIDGKPDKSADKFWYYGDIDTKIIRYICESEATVPDNFATRKIRYHFYGKQFDDESVAEYFKIMSENNGSCICDRCQGWDIFYAAKQREPTYRGWGMDHYKCMHAAHVGSLPTPAQLMKDCDCKGCKTFRNTKDRKADYFRDKFNASFEQKKYTDVQKKYITMGWLADPQILPDDVKAPEEAKISNWNYRPLKKHFKQNVFEDKRADLPINFYRLTLRKQLAYVHCRLIGVDWKDLEKEADKWLVEVWNTQFNPQCNCQLCSMMKSTIVMRLDVANELLIEPCDRRSYPLGLFTVHFTDRSWDLPIRNKRDYIEYFNKFILRGEFCQCKKCVDLKEKMKDSQFLPPAELSAPTCPICGGRVHNADLIYQNKEIAKAILEQGMDKLIGVKTALCCGCYGKFINDKVRRNMIINMKKGDYLYFNEDKKTVKEIFAEDIPKEEREEGTGTLMIDEYTLPEFSSMHGVIKLPHSLEQEAIKLARTEQDIRAH